MIYELNLNDRAFEAIINKTKRVEIRANTGNHNYGNIRFETKILSNVRMIVAI